MSKVPGVVFLIVTFVLAAGCATSDAPPQKPRYVVIDADMAKELFDRGALFVDLRVPWLYAEGHVPGAVNLTWGRRFNPTQLAEVADKNREIVIYCYGINCDVSGRATQAAVSWGYTGVHYFARGFPAWWAADYPIEDQAEDQAVGA